MLLVGLMPLIRGRVVATFLLSFWIKDSLAMALAANLPGHDLAFVDAAQKLLPVVQYSSQPVRALAANLQRTARQRYYSSRYRKDEHGKIEGIRC